MQAGVPYWHSLLPGGRPVAAGDAAAPLPQGCVESVVIGCGLTGAACALALAEGGRSAVVLDARGLGDGATGRNGGHQFRALAERGTGAAELASARVEAADVAALRAFVSGLGAAERAAVELVQTGGVEVSLDEHEPPFLRDYVEHVDPREAVRFLDRAALLARGLGGHAQAVAAVEYPEAAQLVPGRLVIALVARAIELGATVRTGVEVHAIRSALGDGDGDGARWIVETSAGAAVRCRNVVHASNAYGLSLLPSRLRAHLRAIKGQVIAARAPPGALPLSVVWKSTPDSCEEYALQRAVDGVVILGGCRADSSSGGADADDTAVEPEVSQRLVEELLKLCPGADPQPLAEWCGLMCFSSDSRPVCGPIRESPGQYVALGYNGHGMVRAFSCGRHVAELITGAPVSCPDIATAFNPDRFEG
jgi:glycine/D-amino acid oxidase-like deaminating enzyme